MSVRLSQNARIGGPNRKLVRARPESLAGRMRALLEAGFEGGPSDFCGRLEDAEIKAVRRALDSMRERGELEFVRGGREYVWRLKRRG